ncbi:MAG: hypothetical protein BWX70_03026 [Verrucomicrobia bacterium ADurb.Bin070]|nr:MAG: hypothetical protein BWX70_03026 [Verrucomicrobia bacterium ADurb.Bin070]
MSVQHHAAQEKRAANRQQNQEERRLHAARAQQQHTCKEREQVAPLVIGDDQVDDQENEHQVEGIRIKSGRDQPERYAERQHTGRAHPAQHGGVGHATVVRLHRDRNGERPVHIHRETLLAAYWCVGLIRIIFPPAQTRRHRRQCAAWILASEHKDQPRRQQVEERHGQGTANRAKQIQPHRQIRVGQPRHPARGHGKHRIGKIILRAQSCRSRGQERRITRVDMREQRQPVDQQRHHRRQRDKEPNQMPGSRKECPAQETHGHLTFAPGGARRGHRKRRPRNYRRGRSRPPERAKPAAGGSRPPRRPQTGDRPPARPCRDPRPATAPASCR